MLERSESPTSAAGGAASGTGKTCQSTHDQAGKEPPADNDPTGTQRQEENLFDCSLVHLSLPLSDNFKTPKQHGPLASVSFHYKRFCFFP